MTYKCSICLDRQALKYDVPHWDALTPDQQDLVIELVADIADKESGPLRPLKGLRHALAREQFIESITCNVRGVHD